MKRISLMLDEHLLGEAKRELGVTTNSAAVNYVLKELLRIRKVEGLAEFHGTNIWQGNLDRMRRDRTARRLRRRG